MNLPDLSNDRFLSEAGMKVIVQVPSAHAECILDAVLEHTDLKYGDYDRVALRTPISVQQFRSLPGGRNPATENVVEVPCIEVSFFLEYDERVLSKVLKAIYWAHPYEEPVVQVTPCLRTLHIRGLDENNPNRFWNKENEDWVPEEHRK